MSNFSNNKKMSAELMELLQENCRSCYICNNVIEQRPLQDLYETTSTHSNTKICDFVRKFLGSIETHRRFDANHEWNTNDGDTFVCDQCLSTINEYDLACVTAERIEKSLRAILLQTDALFVNVNKDNEESEGDVSRGDQLMDVLESESVELDELENIENVEICMVEPKIEASFDEFDDNLSQDDLETDKGEQSSETMEESRRSTRRRPLEAGGDDTKRSFECSVCQTTFSHKKDLKKHQVQHRSNGSRTRCSICNFDLEDEQKLEEHVELHKGLSPLQCVICKKTFVHKRNIAPHMQYHTKMPEFECTKCTKTFVRSSSLRKHMKTHLKMNINDKQPEEGEYMEENIDGGVEQLSCEQSQQAENVEDVANMKKVVKVENVAIVSSMEKIVNLQNIEAMENIENIAIAEIPLLESDINTLCDEDFDIENDDELENLKKSSEDIIIKVKCTTSVPRRTRKGRPSRMGNEEMEHNYECSVCHMTFVQKKDYKEHRAQHRSEDNRTKCSICNFDLEDEKKLEEHVELHKGLSPLQCVICQKLFTHKRNIIPHMRLHAGMKRYQCDRCGKEYLHKSSFTLHMNYHNNIRPLKCVHCTSRYLTKTDLERHMLCHTGERPYSCEICGKSFARRYNMRDHMKTHSTETFKKEHQCQFCDSAFTRKSKLNKHLDRHHGAVIPHTEIHNNLLEVQPELGIITFLT